MTSFSDSNLIEKNVFILSHHRSGSSWFTRSFKNHFIVGEIFHPWLSINAIKDTEISYLRPDLSKKIDSEEMISAKINIVKMLMQKHKVVVKTHINVLNNKTIFDFLLNLSADSNSNKFILIERQNKYDTFISHLIALYENRWNSLHDKKFPIDSTNISPTMDQVRTVLNEMQSFEISKPIITENFNIEHYYYSDLLSEPENKFWFPNESKFNAQNKKATYNILNIPEILSTVDNSSYIYKDELCFNIAKCHHNTQ